MCKRVMAEVGWPVPNVIATSSDSTAQQIFAIANTELGIISEAHNWPHLEMEYEFTTVPGQSLYLWPVDFRVQAQQGIFDASQYYHVKGSMNLQDWYRLKEGLLGSLSQLVFRNYVTQAGVQGIEITPTPTGAQDLVATYYTQMYARTDADVHIPKYMVDTDVSKVPESYVELGVKWRFRRAKGLDFSVELAEYNSTVRTQYAKYISAAEIPVGGRRINADWPITNGYVPDNGFGV
jgi:hypothetical protein